MTQPPSPFSPLSRFKLSPHRSTPLSLSLPHFLSLFLSPLSIVQSFPLSLSFSIYLSCSESRLFNTARRQIPERDAVHDNQARERPNLVAEALIIHRSSQHWRCGRVWAQDLTNGFKSGFNCLYRSPYCEGSC